MSTGLAGLCSVGTDPQACRYSLLIGRCNSIIGHEIALRRSGASHGAEAIGDEGKAFPIPEFTLCIDEALESRRHHRHTESVHRLSHDHYFHIIRRSLGCRRTRGCTCRPLPKYS